MDTSFIEGRVSVAPLGELARRVDKGEYPLDVIETCSAAEFRRQMPLTRWRLAVLAAKGKRRR
jgi:hypothetical protein